MRWDLFPAKASNSLFHNKSTHLTRNWLKSNKSLHNTVFPNGSLYNTIAYLPD